MNGNHHWQAKWIWLDYITPWTSRGEFRSFKVVGVKEEEKNRFGLFRKTFTLPPDYSPGAWTGSLFISVDGRYKAYLNGRYIGRGIYRCDRFNWYCDEYEVARALRPGKNVIAIVAQFFGESMSWYDPMPHGGLSSRNFGKGSLIFELLVQNDRRRVEVVSDETTRGQPCDAWEHDTPLIYFGLPRLEIYHVDKWPTGWPDINFDDSGPAWDHVIEIDPSGVQPHTVVCDIPRLSEERVETKQLLSAGTIEPYFDEEDLRDSLEPGEEPIDFFLQLGLSEFAEVDEKLVKAWDGKWPLTISLDGKQPFGLVWDLTKERSGFPFFEIETDIDGVVASLGWSEGLMGVPFQCRPEFNPYQVKTGLQVHCEKGRTAYEAFHWHGFRYLQLNLEAPPGVTGKVRLQSIGVNQYLYPVEDVGTFQCSDPRLNELVEACRWTLRNCMHDGYEDCPSREQRQWVGDAYVEILVNYRLFGDTALARKLIRQVAQSQRGDGLTQMATPGDWEIHGTLIPDYTLYWISILYEYYQYTGDLDLVKEVFPSVIRAIRWFLTYVNPKTGLLTEVPYWIFIDWSVNDKWGASCPVNAQFYHVLTQAMELAELIEWDAAVDGFEKVANRLKAGINRFFWDEVRGGYVDAVQVSTDSISIERFSDKVTFHGNTLPILYDIAPEDRISKIISHVFDLPDERLFVNNQAPLWSGKTSNKEKFDPREHVVIAEPFFMHHVHQMFAKVGRYDLIMRFLRDGWLEMLDHGATTIWESWGNGASLCHAWSTTPAYDLMTHCLGVQISAPGATKISIQPHLMGLAWAEGSVPTVNGPVLVRWNWDPGAMQLTAEYSAPPGVMVEVVPPKIGGHLPELVNSSTPTPESPTVFLFSYD